MKYLVLGLTTAICAFFYAARVPLWIWFVGLMWWFFCMTIAAVLNRRIDRATPDQSFDYGHCENRLARRCHQTGTVEFSYVDGGEVRWGTFHPSLWRRFTPQPAGPNGHAASIAASPR